MLKSWFEKAKANPKRILFTDENEARVQEAVHFLNQEGLAHALFLKDCENAESLGKSMELLKSLRGMNDEEAAKAMENPHVRAALLLKMDTVDSVISGPTGTAKTRVLPALQLIKTDHPDHRASGVMIMLMPLTTNPDAANGGVLLFADCALNISPSTEELAQIAIDSAQTAKRLGLDPKIALLSFSTTGSTPHPLSEKMKIAADLARKKAPDLAIEGELQVDAALIDSIGAKKAPGSPIAGHANVLIFPDLEAGNIGYKLVERLAGASAIGPILQGLQKPYNEVSRGANTQDIVNLAVVSSLL